MEQYQPRYSGPKRSGICTCGHSWEQHHRMIVMNSEYVRQTHEGYVLGECEHYGFNEIGGMKFVNGEWVEHCSQYHDSKETNG